MRGGFSNFGKILPGIFSDFWGNSTFQNFFRKSGTDYCPPFLDPPKTLKQRGIREGGGVVPLEADPGGLGSWRSYRQGIFVWISVYLYHIE
jgi:hypothetical protein